MGLQHKYLALLNLNAFKNQEGVNYYSHEIGTLLKITSAFHLIIKQYRAMSKLFFQCQLRM